jgi:hypothetical protein
VRSAGGWSAGGSLMEDAMEEQLIETWSIHDRINRYLLQAIPADALGSVLGPKHRTVYQLFSCNGSA